MIPQAKPVGDCNPQKPGALIQAYSAVLQQSGKSFDFFSEILFRPRAQPLPFHDILCELHRPPPHIRIT